MTILNRIAACTSARRRWIGFGGALLVLSAAAWLFMWQGDSAQANRDEFKFRPIVAANDAAPRRSITKSARHPLDDALEFVQPSLAALKNVKDYTAVFTKTEFVHE
ncbi:MAG TPA: hypothetical protein VGH74_08615, partial [Planctomycetaceae bacterium]